jgi:hypothetical protein
LLGAAAATTADPAAPSSLHHFDFMSASPLPLRRARAKAAVLGAFVADAASCPLQWIYDLAALSSLLAPSPSNDGTGGVSGSWEFDGTSMRDPAFFPRPR